MPRGVHPRGNDARCVVEISGQRKNSLKLCIRECNVQSATIKEHWNAASEVTTLRRYSNLFIVIIIITITQWKGGISVWWSRTSYALAAWGGFLTGQQINRINVFFRKVRRFGLCSSRCVCDVSEYLSLTDSKLFKSTQSPCHCLSHILPPEKNLSGLRSRGHGYVLPIYQYSFCKKLFYSPDAYFIFVIVHFSVWFVYWCLFLYFSFFKQLRCHLLFSF